MSGSVVVVVIVGAVVCVIAAAMVLGRWSPMTGSQPATAWRPTALADPQAPGGTSAAWTPPDFADDVGEVDPEAPFEPLPPEHRLRSAALLTTSVVVIGLVAAALIGVTALVVVHLANEALGP